MNPNRSLPTHDLIAEVEWLAGTDKWDNISARLGYKHPLILGRRLDRDGRHDLATHFYQYKYDHRTSNNTKGVAP